MNDVDYSLTLIPCRHEKRWKRRANGQITVLLNKQEQVCLTGLGTDIFERCNGKTTVAGIIAGLSEKYPSLSEKQIGDELFNLLHYLEKGQAMGFCSDDL